MEMGISKRDKALIYHQKMLSHFIRSRWPWGDGGVIKKFECYFRLGDEVVHAISESAKVRSDEKQREWYLLSSPLPIFKHDAYHIDKVFYGSFMAPLMALPLKS